MCSSVRAASYSCLIKCRTNLQTETCDRYNNVRDIDDCPLVTGTRCQRWCDASVAEEGASWRGGRGGSRQTEDTAIIQSMSACMKSPSTQISSCKTGNTRDDQLVANQGSRCHRLPGLDHGPLVGPPQVERVRSLVLLWWNM